MLRQYLDKAGAFPVEQIPCPHFAQQVDLAAPPAGVLHTTEGNWAGSLAVFKSHYAPHFLLGFDETDKKVRIAQLVPVGFIGAALVTHNWLARVQIEMIGYSQERPWAEDEPTMDALAALMAVCFDEYGIPLQRAWPDTVYGRASASDPHRNQGQFGTVAGWFGHGDCPSPDSHWDPGEFQWSAAFVKAKALRTGFRAPRLPVPPRPCGGLTTLDEDLLYAVMHADGPTKAAILTNLSHGG